MKRTFLVVEDNYDFVRVLGLHLERLDIEIVHAADGEEGLKMALSQSFDLIILDINLPKLDGLAVLDGIRKENSVVPIMMLTSRAEEVDKVVGLELGADDYVTKPFGVAEFIARVKALLRRKSVSGETESLNEEVLVFDDLRISGDSREVTLAGESVNLTSLEFDILFFLASRPGHAYSREELLKSIWEYEASSYAKSVNTLIQRVRAKLKDDPSNPRFIKSLRGYGYCFVGTEES